MAEIVNKKQPITEAQKTATAEKKRHDLYNHVAIEELYEYNPTILEINRVSKAFFGQYITQSVKYWSERLSTLGFFGTSYGLFKGDTKNEICHLEVRQREGLSDTDPTEVISSVMEIVDPYDVKSSEPEDLYTRLKSFIDLGLYPLVCEPMTDYVSYEIFEKYDALWQGRNCIGTIVNVDRLIHPNTMEAHIVATILWNPEFVQGYSQELLVAKAGYLKLCDMRPTPEVWQEKDEVLNTNIGVPIYLFQPLRQSVEEIRFVDGYEEYLNEAVVTGNVTLDFVSNILQHTGETLSEIISSLEKGEIPKVESPISKEDPSQSSATPELQEDIPVENAAEKDLFGHRLRLYDEDFQDGTEGIDLRGDNEYPDDFYFG